MPLEPFNLGLRMAGGFDSDALTAFAAVESAGGSLTGVQKAAVNTAVLALKAASLWTPLVAWYPIVGGSAAAHSINFKNPGTYNITWVNSPTHDSGGVLSNGTTSYGDTGLTTTAMSAAGAFGVCCREAGTPANSTMLGMQDTVNGSRRIYFAPTTTISKYGVVGTSAAGRIAAMYASCRVSSTSHFTLVNGTASSENTNPDPYFSSVYTLFICALNNNGTASNWLAKKLTQAWAAPSFSTANVGSLYTILNAMETTLGRNV